MDYSRVNTIMNTTNAYILSGVKNNKPSSITSSIMGETTLADYFNSLADDKDRDFIAEVKKNGFARFEGNNASWIAYYLDDMKMLGL